MSKERNLNYRNSDSKGNKAKQIGGGKRKEDTILKWYYDQIFTPDFSGVSYRIPWKDKNAVCKYMHWFWRYLSLENE